jgi:hypothetical protein
MKTKLYLILYGKVDNEPEKSAVFETTWSPNEMGKEMREWFMVEQAKIYSDLWPGAKFRWRWSDSSVVRDIGVVDVVYCLEPSLNQNLVGGV